MVVYVSKNGQEIGVIQLDNDRMKFYFNDESHQQAIPQFKGRMWVGEAALINFLKRIMKGNMMIVNKEEFLKKIVDGAVFKDELYFHY